MDPDGAGHPRRVPQGFEVIDPRLLEILACPRCDDRPPLREDGNLLICTQCGARYPVVDGIPQLLPESALAEEES